MSSILRLRSPVHRCVRAACEQVVAGLSQGGAFVRAAVGNVTAADGACAGDACCAAEDMPPEAGRGVDACARVGTYAELPQPTPF